MENKMPASAEGRATSATSKTSQKMSKNFKMFILGLIGFIVVLVVGFTVFGVVRAYISQSGDGLTVMVAKVLRLPIGKVNDQPIYYSDYVSDLRAINTLSDWQAAQGGGPYAEMDDEMLSDMVLEKLVGAAVVRQTARDLGADVAEEDVQELLEYNIAQFASEEEFVKEINNMYGWSLDDYIENALRPAALQLSIEDKVQENADFLREVRERMEGILQELQNGADFAELAKQYSEDNTAAQGGDLGWFGEGEMVPQFEEVAFALKPGEMSNAIVESPYGLHIIKVDDRRAVERENSDGEMEEAVEVKARHIFIAYPSASTYLRQKIDEARIHIYGTVHNPFEEPEEDAEVVSEGSEETTE